MIDYSYLRPQKANALRKWHKGDFYKKNDLSCAAYDNAVILPVKRLQNETILFGHGGVVFNGEYVELSGIEGRVGGYYPYHEVAKSSETVVYCGYLARQWGHFLIESVSRLWYCFEDHTDIDKFIFITDSNASTDISGNYKEFLELLGIWKKVELINHPIEYKKVYIPELGYSRKNYYSEEYLHIFNHVTEQALIKCSLQDSAKRVFLSRGRFSKAKKMEVGLELLDHYFETNGYKLLYPEQLSLSNMIYYLNNAEICAAESGSLPHNFLFLQYNKNCVIIERQTTVNEIQANIDLIRDLNVTYIDGHFTIYPVTAGYGPFFIAYTSCFDNYTRSKNYISPQPFFTSESYVKKCLKQYMKMYHNEYGYKWGMESWMIMYADSIYEAYTDSLNVLGRFLSGETPFELKQLFNPIVLKRKLKDLTMKKHRS